MMPKGKPWNKEDVDELLALRREGATVSSIAAQLGKSEQAIQKKFQRLGLKVVHLENSTGTTTSELILPKELPSVEEVLVTLAGALEALKKPGLNRTEVLRLKSVIQAVRIYKELLADYVDYRGIETRLIEFGRKHEELVRATLAREEDTSQVDSEEVKTG